MIFDLLDGLVEIRSYQVIHSDIKLENILKTKENTYVYSDFGCASKQLHTLKGRTPGYAPPENDK